MTHKTAAGQGDNLPLAVVVIVLTVFALSLGDALIKISSSNFVIWQIFVLRSAVAVPCLIVFMLLKARQSLAFPGAPWWVVLRSLLLVVMWVSYYVSLPYLQLSVAAAAFYTLPLFDGPAQNFLVAEWAAMGVAEWRTMILLAIAILVGSIGTAIAYQNGPSSIIGVFDFAYVGFAVLWGVIFFAEIPDLISVTGMGLIVVAGVLSLIR